MTYTLVVRETVERAFLVDAESEQAAREIFEKTPMADLNEPDDEQVIERGIAEVLDQDGEPLCTTCGASTSGGEGWNGKCGNCADKDEICECGRYVEECTTFDGAEEHYNR